MVPSYAAGMSLTDAGRSSRGVEGALVYRDTLPITGQQSRSVLQPQRGRRPACERRALGPTGVRGEGAAYTSRRPP